MNGIDLYKASHERAANALKSTDDIVEMVVVYNPEGELFYMYLASFENSFFQFSL